MSDSLLIEKLQKKIELLKREINELKEKYNHLDDGFDVQAWKSGRWGASLSKVCERPKYGVACLFCSSCVRNIKIAKRIVE